MGWLSDAVGGVLDFAKKIDPAFKFGTNLAQDTSTKLVRETSRVFEKVGGDSALGRAGEHWKGMADKDNKDQKRWATNTLKTAAAVYGGMISAGEGAGSTVGGSGSIGGGEALGSGATYYEAGGGAVTDGAYGLSGATGETAAGAGGYLEAEGGGYVAPDGGYTPNTGASTSNSAGTILGKVADNKAAQSAALEVAKAAAAKKPAEPTQAPTKRPVVEMPDAEAQTQARRRKLAEQLARRGRAASIMTADGS